ncbi:unnamed protein product [Rotaria sp. Silwood2]|nr:unnamed protein product [Rotaria sp. Silwood2]
MTESDGQKLQDYLTSLRDGLQLAATRTTSIETTLTTVQSTVTQLEQNFNEKVHHLSKAQELKYQQLDDTIQHLDTQFQDFRTYVSTQISKLTAEIRATLAAVRTSPPVPSPTTPLPPSSSNNSIHSHSLLNVPSPPDTLLSLPARQTVIIQQATIAPSFSGKADEKPRPFLLQLHQYTNSSYGWDKEMLLQNIGQFLKGTAFEWYIQIITSHSPPLHWDTFQTLFLQQFSSPLRLAQIEQEWNRSIQRPDESIIEFLVRLRSLWSEHKPNETERDLVRHLFTKIRPELVPLIGVLSDPTLENFLERAREAELIDFSRSKQTVHIEKSNTTISATLHSSTSSHTSNPRQSYIICYKCNTPGHLASQCPRTQSSRYPSNSKN